MSKRSESPPEQQPPEYSPRKLRLLRDWELRLSQEELAEKMNCDPRTIQRYEKGDSPIPPEFIRKFEKLRVTEKERRARELGEGEIDWNSVIIPGLELIELRPIRKVAGKLFRMFVAMPKDSHVSDAEGEQPSPAPTPADGSAGGSAPRADSGMVPEPTGAARTQTVPLLLAKGSLPEGTVLVENVLPSGVETSETLTRSFSAVQGIVPPPDHGQGRSVAIAQQIPAMKASKSGRRLLNGLAMAAGLACWTLVTGCLLSHRGPDEPAERELLRLPEKLYTDNATNGNGAMGQQIKRSIKMPDKPYSWQKVAPCDQGEREKVGGCWLYIGDPPPCSEAAVESAGECYVPVPAKPKKPNTVDPDK